MHIISREVNGMINISRLETRYTATTYYTDSKDKVHTVTHKVALTDDAYDTEEQIAEELFIVLAGRK